MAPWPRTPEHRSVVEGSFFQASTCLDPNYFSAWLRYLGAAKTISPLVLPVLPAPFPCLTQRALIKSPKCGVNLLAFCLSHVVRSDHVHPARYSLFHSIFFFKSRHYPFPVHPTRYYQHVNVFPNERFGISSKAVSPRYLRAPGFRFILTSPARTRNGGSQFCGGPRSWLGQSSLLN